MEQRHKKVTTIQEQQHLFGEVAVDEQKSLCEEELDHLSLKVLAYFCIVRLITAINKPKRKSRLRIFYRAVRKYSSNRKEYIWFAFSWHGNCWKFRNCLYMHIHMSTHHVFNLWQCDLEGDVQGLICVFNRSQGIGIVLHQVIQKFAGVVTLSTVGHWWTGAAGEKKAKV